MDSVIAKIEAQYKKKAVVDVRSGDSVKVSQKKWLPQLLKKIIANQLSQVVARGFVKDFLPDVPIWENKKYIAEPNYLAGETGFDEFRRWAAQFY